jgi:hypothetical protein
MIRLVIVIVVLGAGAYVAHHWWDSRSSGGNGGYSGVAARRYRTAYALCKRTVGGKFSLSGRLVHVMQRSMRGRYRAAALAGCTAGAKAAGGLTGALSQLMQGAP